VFIVVVFCVVYLVGSVFIVVVFCVVYLVGSVLHIVIVFYNDEHRSH
jgi:hypothetical protein